MCVCEINNGEKSVTVSLPVYFNLFYLRLVTAQVLNTTKDGPLRYMTCHVITAVSSSSS